MIKFFAALLALIFAASVFQLYLPPLVQLKGAVILFTPALFFYGCLSLPFPLMLALTLVTGFLHDLLWLPETNGGFILGTSILLYLVPGLIMHGFRPIFLRHQWQVHFLLAELSAILTPFLFLASYSILSFEHRDFSISSVIIWRIVGPGIISLFIAPCVFFILTPLSHALKYRPR
jgi:hypothetical protein